MSTSVKVHVARESHRHRSQNSMTTLGDSSVELEPNSGAIKVDEFKTSSDSLEPATDAGVALRFASTGFIQSKQTSGTVGSVDIVCSVQPRKA